MSLFRPDGLLYRVIVKFTSMVLLSLCWFVCCIPIVTVGASTTALYAVCFKMLMGEDAHIVKKFFAYFKSNFKKATLEWLIILPVGVLILWMGYLYFFGMTGVDGAADFLAMIVLIAAAVYIIMLTYVFACTARYENTVLRTLKNAVFIGMRYIGRTIILAAVTAAVLFVCLWNMTTVFLGVIFAPAFLCYVHGSFILKLFEKIEEAQAEKADA